MDNKKINVEIPEAGAVPGGIYENPLSDSGFKRLLCSEKSLTDFLNSCMHLDESRRIDSLTFKTKRITYNTTDSKDNELETWTFDIRAKTCDNRNIDVEVQNLRHDFFEDRVLTYGAALLLKAKAELDQERKVAFEKAADSEEKLRKTYEIPETVCIWVCNFAQPKDSKRVWDDWMLYSKGDLDEGRLLPATARIKYIFLQLPNFKKKADELESNEDQWLYILKNAFESKAEIKVSNDAVNEALERIKVVETKKENPMITKREYDCTIASAKHEAREEGRAEGRAEGREEGRVEGREQGRNEGLAEGVKLVASNLLKKNMPVQQVAELSGLSLEEVKALNDSLNKEKS